jgi:predicted aspartyl protease
MAALLPIVLSIAACGNPGGMSNASGPTAPGQAAYVPPYTPEVSQTSVRDDLIRVPIVPNNGHTYTIEVGIGNGVRFVQVPFILDTGAADVSVSPAIFSAMYNPNGRGLITDDDLIDLQKYRTANGVVEGLRFRMPPMRVGNRIVYGVVGSVNKGSTMMLLGQSFLRKFSAFMVDYQHNVLVLG